MQTRRQLSVWNNNPFKKTNKQKRKRKKKNSYNLMTRTLFPVFSSWKHEFLLRRNRRFDWLWLCSLSASMCLCCLLNKSVSFKYSLQSVLRVCSCFCPLAGRYESSPVRVSGTLHLQVPPLGGVRLPSPGCDPQSLDSRVISSLSKPCRQNKQGEALWRKMCQISSIKTIQKRNKTHILFLAIGNELNLNWLATGTSRS